MAFPSFGFSPSLLRAGVLLACTLVIVCGCSSTGSSSGLSRQVTRVRVTPEAFPGDVSCAAGGIARYQATLIDITAGEENAFSLPSSRLVDCRSEVLFDFVEPGHRYMAEVTGYAAAEVRAQNPGSNVVVDAAGKEVAADISIRCTGDDRIQPNSLTAASMGGMGGTGAGDGLSGEPGGAMGGDSPSLGILALYLTTVTVRGCSLVED